MLLADGVLHEPNCCGDVDVLRQLIENDKAICKEQRRQPLIYHCRLQASHLRGPNARAEVFVYGENTSSCGLCDTRNHYLIKP